MKSTWFNYYHKRIGFGYTKYAAKKYAAFISEILLLSGSITEDGCGIGTISKILKSNGRTVQSFDMLLDMVKLSQMNTIQATQKNITIPVVSDIYTSHGVLEHLSDSIIHIILNIQSKLGKHSVHYVPSNKYSNQSFGDERLMTASWWKETFSPDKVVEFNQGKDLALVWNW